MKFIKRLFEFPLLFKELAEQSSRPRTYILRFVYAAALFIGGCLVIYGRTGGAVDVASRSGEGRAIFLDLFKLQCAGILIFMPAMTAGVLTSEKERDSLALLLLTHMSPWRIVFQKLISRLIPMWSFLLLTFPLLAVAYTYGGLSRGELVLAMLLLAASAVEVGTIAIACSSYCRTTSEAYMLTYVCLFVLGSCLTPFLPIAMPFRSRTQDITQLTPYLLLSLQVIAVTFLLAVIFLRRRAFVPPRNILLELFQKLDTYFEELNQVTGGVVVLQDGERTPDAAPIAWRETAKKSLGTYRYLFRVVTVLEVPVLVAAALLDRRSMATGNGMSMLLDILWWIAIGMICVHASGLISGERSRQTLDVLLTAPMGGADVIRQKLAGVRRLIAVLMVPFVTIFIAQHLIRDERSFAYLLLSLGTVLVYLPLTAWIAFAIGVRMPSQLRAILTSLIVVLTVSLLPMLLGNLAHGSALADAFRFLTQLSAASVVSSLEWTPRYPPELYRPHLWMAAASLVIHGLCLWGLRSHCLRSADRLLQRVPEPTSPKASMTASTP